MTNNGYFKSVMTLAKTFATIPDMSYSSMCEKGAVLLNGPTDFTQKNYNASALKFTLAWEISEFLKDPFSTKGNQVAEALSAVLTWIRRLVDDVYSCSYVLRGDVQFATRELLRKWEHHVPVVYRCDRMPVEVRDIAYELLIALKWDVIYEIADTARLWDELAAVKALSHIREANEQMIEHRLFAGIQDYLRSYLWPKTGLYCMADAVGDIRRVALATQVNNTAKLFTTQDCLFVLKYLLPLRHLNQYITPAIIDFTSSVAKQAHIQYAQHSGKSWSEFSDYDISDVWNDIVRVLERMVVLYAEDAENVQKEVDRHARPC